jgi:hypothetical protein
LRSSWRLLVLAAAVAVTAAATAASVAVTAASPSKDDSARPGLVPTGHRIVALTTEGATVVLDARTGRVSEVVDEGEEPLPQRLELSGAGHHAYVSPEGRSVIETVRLRTGEHRRRADGSAFCLGRRSFTDIARDIPRPEVDVLAYVTGDGTRHAVVVENVTTGSRHRIGPASGGDAVRRIEDLAWSPFENRVFGVADRGRTLFVLDGIEARTLDEVRVRRAPGRARFVDITPLGDGLAAVVRRPGGRTQIVSIGPDLAMGSPVAAGLRRPVAVDASPDAQDLLVVDRRGRLHAVTGAATPEARVETIADGLVRAAW